LAGVQRGRGSSGDLPGLHHCRGGHQTVSTGNVNQTGERKVNLEIGTKRIVTNQLGRDQRSRSSAAAVTVPSPATRAEGRDLCDRARAIRTRNCAPSRGTEPARGAKICPPAADGRNSSPPVRDRGGGMDRTTPSAESPALGRMKH